MYDKINLIKRRELSLVVIRGEIMGYVICPECRRSGSVTCPVCRGSRKDPRNSAKDCGYCRGNGKIECDLCGGKGSIPVEIFNDRPR